MKKKRSKKKKLHNGANRYLQAATGKKKAQKTSEKKKKKKKKQLSTHRKAVVEQKTQGTGEEEDKRSGGKKKGNSSAPSKNTIPSHTEEDTQERKSGRGKEGTGAKGKGRKGGEGKGGGGGEGGGRLSDFPPLASSSSSKTSSEKALPAPGKKKKKSPDGRGVMKITDRELRAELESGLSVPEIGAKYNMNYRSLYRRVRKMRQDDLDNLLVSYNEAGDPLLNTRSQIATLNRMTFDILRDSKSSANTKLTAIRRAEQQNELQAKMEQIKHSLEQTEEFQRTVISCIDDLDIQFPGAKVEFIRLLRQKRALHNAVRR